MLRGGGFQLRWEEVILFLSITRSQMQRVTGSSANYLDLSCTEVADLVSMYPPLSIDVKPSKETARTARSVYLPPLRDHRPFLKEVGRAFYAKAQGVDLTSYIFDTAPYWTEQKIRPSGHRRFVYDAATIQIQAEVPIYLG